MLVFCFHDSNLGPEISAHTKKACKNGQKLAEYVAWTYKSCAYLPNRQLYLCIFQSLFSPFRPIIVKSQQDTQNKNLKSAIKDTLVQVLTLILFDNKGLQFWFPGLIPLPYMLQPTLHQWYALCL